MNILWVSLYPPLPLNFGGPVGIYKRLVELRKYNNVFLFYINEDNDRTYDMRLSELCVEVHSYKRNKIYDKDSLIKIISYPLTAATRYVTKMQIDIEKCIIDNKIDLINVEFPQMCVNLTEVHTRYPDIPIVLHEHNNEWVRFSQMADAVSGLRKYMYKRESRLLYKLERKLEESDLVNLYTFLSNKDQAHFIDTFNIEQVRTALVPLGADVFEKEHIKRVDNNKIIMFCAAMDSEMNQEATLWFVEMVLPLIKDKIDNLIFYIVGRNPSDEINKLANESVIVTGTVESLAEYYNKADLVVIPLLHGGGVKVKLLEAVGYDKNIVTTSVGIEGTLFDNKAHIPVCDDATEFANACIKILLDGDYAVSLRESTRKFFLENYTWERIGQKYNYILTQVSQKFFSSIANNIKVSSGEK